VTEVRLKMCAWQVREYRLLALKSRNLSGVIGWQVAVQAK
jgi:hypothetical protein